MTRALRIATLLVLVGAAGAVLAQVETPCGGEANIPFEGCKEHVAAVAPAPVEPEVAMTNACGDGEANVPFEGCKAEELGAGAGEPGRAAPALGAGYNDPEFLRQIWTAP